MPCYIHNKIPENYYIFKEGKWLQLVDGYVNEPGKQYATRLEFTYKTNDNFTLIPFNKVVESIRLLQNSCTDNENSQLKSSFKNRYKRNLQRKNRRLVREMAKMKRKLNFLEHDCREKRKRYDSYSKTSSNETTVSSFISGSTLDRKIVNKIKALKNLCKEKKHENNVINSKNINRKPLNEKIENEIQKPNFHKSLEIIKEVVIPNETIDTLIKFAMQNFDFLECIEKDWVNQEKPLEKEENLLNFLYKVNPLVKVEKMNLFLTLTKNNISNVTLTSIEEDSMTLEDFAARLGLINVRKSEIVKDKLREKRACKEGLFRSVKRKAFYDSMLKIKNNYGNVLHSKELRKKLFANDTTSSSNSETSIKTKRVRKKFKPNKGETPITKFMKKFRSQLNKEKQETETVSRNLFTKTPLDENFDYFKNLQKDLQNIRKKEATNEAGPSSSCNTTSPIKRQDLDRFSLSDPSTLVTVQRIANVEAKQVKKILRENNTNKKVQRDFDADKGFNDSNDKADVENSLKRGIRNQKSKIISYIEKRAAKSYSMAEDTVILNFILRHRYENKVNGNIIWKELEMGYHIMTQEKRTWQSLRNRYLRHILKDLKDYGLSPDDERKLRIGSHLGSGTIKVKTNSLSPVKSAWNVGRQKQARNSDELLKKGTRLIKEKNDVSLAVPRPSTPRTKRPRSDHLTYSGAMKKFSKDHIYSYSDSSDNEKDMKHVNGKRTKLYTATVH